MNSSNDATPKGSDTQDSEKKEETDNYPHKCLPGTFNSASGLRKLFPSLSQSFHQKALVAIPIGASGRRNISSLVQSMGHAAFDYRLFAYDNTDWRSEPWYNQTGVAILRMSYKAMKWTF